MNRNEDQSRLPYRDATLDAIDNALAGWAVSGDAMRWTPDGTLPADEGKPRHDFQDFLDQIRYRHEHAPAWQKAWWRARGLYRNLASPPPWCRLRWRWQRSCRGYADCDLWSLDSYIPRLLSAALADLAAVTHSYPGTAPWETPGQWQAHLLELSARLGAWNDDTFLDETSYEQASAAMEEFGRNLGHYWD